MVVVNGRLDLALLVAVPGGALRADAADAWKRLVKAVHDTSGYTLAPTSYADTYRSYAVQERIFRQRYTTSYVTGIDPRQWLGQTWWRLAGYAAAAIPGTSNHGLGVAVDIAYMGGFYSAKYKAVTAAAAAHGWDNREGRSIAEPWHWRYRPENDTHPTAPLPEDDMLTEADRLILRKDMLEQAEKAVANHVADIVARTTAALLGADVGAGTLAQAVRDSRIISRRTEKAVLALDPAAPPAIDYAALAAALVAHIKP